MQLWDFDKPADQQPDDVLSSIENMLFNMDTGNDTKEVLGSLIWENISLGLVQLFVAHVYLSISCIVPNYRFDPNEE